MNDCRQSSRGMTVRGRFAPTPSGPLHFGSVLAALASFLDARSLGGEWIVRIEDVDHPRTVPGAAQGVLRTLEALALPWDGPVVHQSERQDLYREALERLRREGRAFPCTCSRKAIGEGRGRGIDGGPVYPGFCRGKGETGGPAAWRFLSAGWEPVAFSDGLQGDFLQDVEETVGDFPLLRADGCFTYHLAVVVDDALQGITHVVRGSDLLDSTARQILLQRALGYPTPAYFHIPVVVGADGAKLSKQTLAPAVEASCAAGTLVSALEFLGQRPPRELARQRAADVVAWALESWDRAKVPAVREAGLPGHSPGG